MMNKNEHQADNEQQYTLKDIARVLRPMALEEVANAISWKQKVADFLTLLNDSPSGMLIINEGPSSSGRLFLKYLANEVSLQYGVEVIRGVVAEPITEHGWLLKFLGQSLGEAHSHALTSTEILRLAQDISERCGSLAIIIDGLSLVEQKYLVGDISGMLRLFSDGNIKFLMMTSLPDQSIGWFLDHELLKGQSVSFLELPKLEVKEIADIVRKRLSSLKLDSDTSASLIQTVSKDAKGDPTFAMEILQKYFRDKSTDAKFLQPPSEISGTFAFDAGSSRAIANKKQGKNKSIVIQNLLNQKPKSD